uniref:Uncharacterized protein n=1 Tax=Romanomermis culicivorax TaxID=13658 RepID=A0A915K9R5_ROMCU
NSLEEVYAEDSLGEFLYLDLNGHQEDQFESAIEMFNMFHIQQLVRDIDYTLLNNSLEQIPNFSMDFIHLHNQQMIVGTIDMVETTARYVTYLLKKQWIQTNGPYCRQLKEKYQAYRRYLPDSFQEERQGTERYL